MQLTIEKLIYGGDGLARMPADEHGGGKAVFVPFVLPGERIEASLVEEKPGFARARLEKILQPSPQRLAAPCPYFQACGGCHYQHLDYENQLHAKAAILKENLRRMARLELPNEVQLHASLPWNYRNRTRLRFRAAPFALGYYKFGSHELLPVEQCPISSTLINNAIAATWRVGRAGLTPSASGEIEFFANADDTQLLFEVSGSGVETETVIEKWAETLKTELPDVAGGAWQAGSQTAQGTRRRNRTSRNSLTDSTTFGAGHLIYKTEKAAYRVSAGSFFQVNRSMIDELVAIVTGGVSGRRGMDLYAGVGLFSTVLAKSIDHIEAVESSHSSFADLQYNSPANVKAICAPVDQYLETALQKSAPDLVVVDPPRSGLEEQVARQLSRLGARRITYVSCDPATLARDLKLLFAAGYAVQQAHLVDLFPQTYHLESVLQLAK